MNNPRSNDTIGGGGFHHVAFRAPDFDKAVRFYTEGLGFTEKIRWGEGSRRAILLDTGDGNYVEIFAMEEDGEAPGEGAILHYALRTRDVEAAVEKAARAGAVVTMDPESVKIPAAQGETPVRIAFVKGPCGEVIEFFQSEDL